MYKKGFSLKEMPRIEIITLGTISATYNYVETGELKFQTFIGKEKYDIINKCCKQVRVRHQA